MGHPSNQPTLASLNGGTDPQSIPGQAVAGAGHPLEELGNAVHKVDDLGDEEHEQRLREVAQDARHCQSHAREVGECVANEDLKVVGSI